MAKVKATLEIGIIRWTDYQERHKEALEYLNSTESIVQKFNGALQPTLQDKRKSLEDFQVELQKIFDWQAELDDLNGKAQALLETCADSRVSNGITQITAKYQALILLAKDVMRRLEIIFQEHHQHESIFADTHTFIEKTREKLSQCRQSENTHASLNGALQKVAAVRQSLEQGQNKLRYTIELKDRVVGNTEASGAKRVADATDSLKVDFDRLVSEVQDVKNNLSNRFDLLGDIDKSNRLLLEWIEEAEAKAQQGAGEGLLNTLGEKRARLERNRAILRDLETHRPTVEKLKKKLTDHPNIPNEGFAESISRFDKLTTLVETNIASLETQSADHEAYQRTVVEAREWMRKTRADLQQCGDTQGSDDELAVKKTRLGELIESLKEGDALVAKAADASHSVIEVTGEEGRDIIWQEQQHLKQEWEQLRNSARQASKALEKTSAAWTEFNASATSAEEWLKKFGESVAVEAERTDKDSSDLDRRREMLREANRQKYDMETLNERCEVLVELSACASVRDRTVAIQTAFSNLYSTVQGLLNRTERSVADHSDFHRAREDYDEWHQRAAGTVNDSLQPSDANNVDLAERLSQVRTVASRMTEGQHLLNCAAKALVVIADSTPSQQADAMQSSLTSMRSSFDQLNSDVNAALAKLEDLQQQRSDLLQTFADMEEWAKQTRETLAEKAASRGEVGEMRTLLERYRNMAEDIAAKGDVLKDSGQKAAELAEVAKDENITDRARELCSTLATLETECQSRLNGIQGEMSAHADYQAAMQETEKWLLQMSFQLMAHNSLYITTREQAQEQIARHEKLMDDIKAYQSSIDAVREKGEKIVIFLEILSSP
jgi:nesprin-1